MSLAGCQINPIDVNFHLQESLEIFDTNSADKFNPEITRGVKVPCLMPIRVKARPGKRIVGSADMYDQRDVLLVVHLYYIHSLPHYCILCI